MASQYESLAHRVLCHAPAFNLHDPDECWEHNGPLNKRNGYPKISVRINGKQTTVYAHRVVFEHVNGPVPEGHEVDHKCHNHRCVRPSHLEALLVPDNRGKNQHSANYRTRKA